MPNRKTKAAAAYQCGRYRPEQCRHPVQFRGERGFPSSYQLFRPAAVHALRGLGFGIPMPRWLIPAHTAGRALLPATKQFFLTLIVSSAESSVRNAPVPGNKPSAHHSAVSTDGPADHRNAESAGHQPSPGRYPTALSKRSPANQPVGCHCSYCRPFSG